MHSSLTDEELLARSVTDPTEFAVLYERHGLAVRLYVRRRVGSQNADDLAAEVFARAFVARERFRAERDNALPWLLVSPPTWSRIIDGLRSAAWRRCNVKLDTGSRRSNTKTRCLPPNLSANCGV